jgi:hypothetical protein
MKKWPILFFAPIFLALATAFAAKATEPDRRPAKFVQPSAMPDSFPAPLMTGDRRYTVANTHSHNDYEQTTPFWTAYNAQFGSIEADIFLVNGTLFVAHDRKELQRGRTLEDYYLKPLADQIGRHHGHPYADSSRQLQMLIDVKADSTAVLAALVTLLEKYPALTQTPSLIWVNRAARTAVESALTSSAATVRPILFIPPIPLSSLSTASWAFTIHLRPCPGS